MILPVLILDKEVLIYEKIFYENWISNKEDDSMKAFRIYFTDRKY